MTPYSVNDREWQNGFDGHINRNIRLSVAMIDLSKPYIYLHEVSMTNSGSLVVKFALNGCIKADYVGAIIGGELQEIATGASCNHLADDG